MSGLIVNGSSTTKERGGKYEAVCVCYSRSDLF